MKDSLMQGFMRAASLGFEMAAAVFIGAAIGYFFDERSSTKPWGLITGVIIGSIAGFINIYRFAVKNERS